MLEPRSQPHPRNTSMDHFHRVLAYFLGIFFTILSRRQSPAPSSNCVLPRSNLSLRSSPSYISQHGPYVCPPYHSTHLVHDDNRPCLLRPCVYPRFRCHLAILRSEPPAPSSSSRLCHSNPRPSRGGEVSGFHFWKSSRSFSFSFFGPSVPCGRFSASVHAKLLAPNAHAQAPEKIFRRSHHCSLT